MYGAEYNRLMQELKELESVPDSQKDDDMREDIKSIKIQLSQAILDDCINGNCDV
jgi:hypothetical protein